MVLQMSEARANAVMNCIDRFCDFLTGTLFTHAQLKGFLSGIMHVTELTRLSQRTARDNWMEAGNKVNEALNA